MALFTDGAIASIEDLRGHDTQLLNVATVEGIDVTRKLALAQEELGVEVAGLLGQAMLSGQLSAPPAIGQVVVTPPLKLWHIFRTLEMFYRDAYNSQLNDRYAGSGTNTARWRSGRTIRLCRAGWGSPQTRWYRRLHRTCGRRRAAWRMAPTTSPSHG